MDDDKLLEVLYERVKSNQKRCGDVIAGGCSVDLIRHHIGAFSAYSEVLNLLDELISRKK